METLNQSQMQAYFTRIGLGEVDWTQRTLDSRFLTQLHEAHVMTVPFENLDVLHKIPLSLEIEVLFDKIVRRHRGGTCFETNGLSAAFLSTLGYGVRDCMSRYFRDAQGEIPMRRHRLLLVETLDGPYVWDIGIGQRSPRHPLRLAPGLVQRQFGESYRLDPEPFFGWVLREFHKGEWLPILSFTEEEQAPVDFVPLTVWCECSPASPFHQIRMVACKTSVGRKTIDGDTFREFCGDAVLEQKGCTPEQLTVLLQEEFGITLSV